MTDSGKRPAGEAALIAVASFGLTYLLFAVTNLNRAVWFASWQGSLYKHYYAAFALVTIGLFWIYLSRSEPDRLFWRVLFGFGVGYLASLVATNMMLVTAFGWHDGIANMTKQFRAFGLAGELRKLLLLFLTGGWLFGIIMALATQGLSVARRWTPRAMSR